MNNSTGPAASAPLLTSFQIRWPKFKADPNEADQHLDPFHSLTFSLGDIRDLRSFAKKLSQKQADPVSAWLRSQLDAGVQSDLEKYNDAQKARGSKRVPRNSADLQKYEEAQQSQVSLQWSLVQCLNKIIKGGRIDEKAHFDVKKQRPLTGSMGKKELHGDDLVRFNRLLLEDEFPELAKEPKKNISLATISGVTPPNSIAENERRNLENDHAIRRAFLWDFESDADNLNWLAGRDQKVLGVLTRTSLFAVCSLADLAKNGQENALRTLVEIAAFAAEVVGGFGLEHVVIREMAKERLAWPVLASTRSEFAPKIDLKALGLCSSLFPNASKIARFEISDPVGKIAYRLYSYVKAIRTKAMAVALAANGPEVIRGFVELVILKRLDSFDH